MNKLMVLVAAALVLGFAGGYCIKAEAERNRAKKVEEEMDHRFLLSSAALKVTESVMLLKLLRENKPDLAAQRLETLLDFALIDIGREYSPARDSFGATSNALRFARAYRTEHPRQAASDDISKRVEAAFQVLPTGAP